jgi:hypothetical protein
VSVHSPFRHKERRETPFFARIAHKVFHCFCEKRGFEKKKDAAASAVSAAAAAAAVDPAVKAKAGGAATCSAGDLAVNDNKAGGGGGAVTKAAPPQRPAAVVGAAVAATTAAVGAAVAATTAAVGAAVAATTSSDEPQKNKTTKLPEPAAAEALPSSSKKVHGDDAGGTTTQLMSREASENHIALMRTNVVNLAKEFQDLNQAAQAKFKSYMEAATALKDAEQMGLAAYLLQLKHTREHDVEVAKTGAVSDAKMRDGCDAEVMRRHAQNMKRTASDAGEDEVPLAALKKSKTLSGNARHK